MTYSYDRQGRRTTMSAGQERWALWHSLDGQLISQAGLTGVNAGLRVTNQLDASLRRTQVAAFTSSGHAASSDFRFDPAGRLASVTDGSAAALYSYATGSLLARQIVFQWNDATRLTTTREYDRLDRLSAVSSRPANAEAPLLAQTYTYNQANQSTRATLADGSYWLYDHDALGQVTSGRRYWADDSPVAGQQFEYAFDDIGNRIGSRIGGDEDGGNLQTSAAAYNDLNQMTVQDVPPAVQVIGAATASATVAINDAPVHRKGEYCQREVPVDNSSKAIWQKVTCRAQREGLTQSVTGHVFVARTPERFVYDLDGNLFQDGRCTYQWDGENRLVEMRTHEDLPPEARFWLVFSYDPLGRRITKEVRRWGSAGWATTQHEKYLYDGWNLLVVLNATNHAVVKSFVWGADQSGEVEGARGVGGLLMVRDEGNRAAFASHDGNGNLIGLVDAVTGQFVAQYEYGPFAELIRASGPRAQANPIRFSSKYQDDESDLYYYGYRYYNARLGRWLSRDPIEHAGGQNDYAFVGNRPNDVTDFHGLAWVVKRISGEAFPDESASMFRWFADPVGLLIGSDVTESSVSVMAAGAYQGLFALIENLTGQVWPLVATAGVFLSCDEEGNILGENDESIRSRDGISVAARVLVSKHGRRAHVTFGAAAIFRGKLKLRAVGKVEQVAEAGIEVDSADLQISRTRTATFECRCQNP